MSFPPALERLEKREVFSASPLAPQQIFGSDACKIVDVVCLTAQQSQIKFIGGGSTSGAVIGPRTANLLGTTYGGDGETDANKLENPGDRTTASSWGASVTPEVYLAVPRAAPAPFTFNGTVTSTWGIVATSPNGGENRAGRAIFPTDEITLNFATHGDADVLDGRAKSIQTHESSVAEPNLLAGGRAVSQNDFEFASNAVRNAAAGQRNQVIYVGTGEANNANAVAMGARNGQAAQMLAGDTSVRPAHAAAFDALFAQLGDQTSPSAAHLSLRGEAIDILPAIRR